MKFPDAIDAHLVTDHRERNPVRDRAEDQNLDEQ